MTATLKEAVQRIERLPEDEQNRYAELLLTRLQAGDTLPTWAQEEIREHAESGTLTASLLMGLLEDVLDNAEADAALAEGGKPIPWDEVRSELA